MNTGKKFRLQRFNYRSTDRGLIVPIDHGLTLGPVLGIENTAQIAKWIRHEAITGVICHKGIAERLVEENLLHHKGLMIHLNGMSNLSQRADEKIRLTTIETALSLGADAVSLQINFQGNNDAQNLELLGSVVDAANRESLPVLAMIYDKVKTDEAQSVSRMQHLIRIAIEMGCDAVKISPNQELNAILNSCTKDIRVFVAGGNVIGATELMELVEQSITAGASGLCVGRNIFQRENVADILSQLREKLEGNPENVTELFNDRGFYGVH